MISEGKMKRSRKTAKTTDTHHYESVPFEVPKGWAFGYGKDLFAPMQSIKPSSDTFYYADIESVDNTTNTLSAKIIKKEFNYHCITSHLRIFLIKTILNERNNFGRWIRY